MCEWEVALTPSRARGCRAGPRDSRCAPRARLPGMAAAFGARARLALAARVTSRGGSKLAVRCALLAALLAVGAAALAPGGCPVLEVASNVVSSQPGASVTLTCPGEELADNANVQWTLGGPPETSRHGLWAGVGRRLLLRSVQLGDSGNYSCYLNGYPVGSVCLLVDVPPEEPRLSCFRRSLISPVTCEWRPQRPPSPTTKAVLVVKKFLNGPANDFQKPCQYSHHSQKFSCQLAIPETDRSSHIVSLCVANTVGSKSSRWEVFDGYEILQPDPPANITVTAMVGKPRWLHVTWQDPSSWNSYFYRLRFELRYRAEQSQDFTAWMVEGRSHRVTRLGAQGLQHHSIIHDAWKGVRHVVQLRAQEEFGHGSWSTWSAEVLGTPWTGTAATAAAAAEEEPESPPASSPATQASTATDGSSAPSRGSINTTSLPDDSSPVPLSTFLVTGGSLAFGALLGAGVVLRFRKMWKLRALKEGKAGVHPPYALGQLVPERPRPITVLVPLISPPVSPSSLGSDNAPGPSHPDAGCPRSPYDVSNKEYFFPR
ncbi:interleukin-6 receptor subunit alpha isoform X2 [Oryctolagus cuniculus]|uniref:interleukin-6 receptor subunit alpha isoform X2 n=1 Tax=Oryctolagus cuniculus TaxID=9986 RepID=UPI0022321EB5|nr:interleukin-6 receptor subunit alpha isoform X2 [Oryctolagus cuniculus]